MLRNRHFQIALALLACSALLLGACTRSATTETLPTTAPDGVGGGGDAEIDATEAFGTAMANTLFSGQTATAQAAIGGGETGPVIGATSTPTIPPIALVTNTPVPPPATATTAPSGPQQYTVKAGDWLYKIARENGVSYRDILAANPGIDPNFLKPGQVITIPAAGVGGGEGGKTYIVKPGDNLFRIALNNGTTYQKLSELNAIPSPYTVYPGQVIKLP
jgi:LysM repeat protein